MRISSCTHACLFRDARLRTYVSCMFAHHMPICAHSSTDGMRLPELCMQCCLARTCIAKESMHRLAQGGVANAHVCCK